MSTGTETITVSIAEARKNLAQVLKLVEAGHHVYLTRRDRAIAVLQPINAEDTKESEDGIES